MPPNRRFLADSDIFPLGDMKITSTKLTKVTIDGKQYWCVTWPKPGKGRSRQHFKNKTEAQTFFDQKQIEQRNGIGGMALNLRQCVEYMECSDKLAPFNATLRDAVDFYLPHLQATNRSCTARQLADEIVAAKTADGASKRYLGDLRNRLKRFADDFDGKPVAKITTAEVDQFLRSLVDSETGKPVAPTTRNNFRRLLNVAFNYACDRGYCASNPAVKTAKAKVIETSVGILTVEETIRLLNNAPENLIPFVAIGAFAGLRRSELERLDWKEVDLESRLIKVTASKAKSARRRFVKIKPNLLEWLQPRCQKQGSVAPAGYRELLDKARKAAGIQTWPNNALRHSFASYYLAHFMDAAAVAHEMGHTNQNLVFQHYREVVKPADAKDFWNIVPPRTQKDKIALVPKAA